jgi:hypothetical protein
MARLISYLVRQTRLGSFEVFNNTTGRVVSTHDDDLAARSIAGSYSEVVDEIGDTPITRGEYSEAFDLVKSSLGWKHPIDAVVSDAQLAELPGATNAVDGMARLQRAVEFFTGSQLHVLNTRRGGCINKSAQPDVHHVAAKGYYLALGA